MSLRIAKKTAEILSAVRNGEDADLSSVVVPRTGGSLLVKDSVDGATPVVSRLRNFMWSDKSMDRDRDSIDPTGWKLNEFQVNGPILWAHNNRLPPIGSPVNFHVDGDGEKGKLLGGIDFSKVNPLAELLLGLIDEGALKNVSVGFIPLKWAYNEERNGIDFMEQELVEGSVVPVGAHPGAMVDAAKAKGLDLSPLREWAEKWLDNDETVAACVADPDDVQAIHKALGPCTTTEAGLIVPEGTTEVDGTSPGAESSKGEGGAAPDSIPEVPSDPAPVCTVADVVEAIREGTLSVETVESALTQIKEPGPAPEPPITADEIRAAVRAALLDGGNIHTDRVNAGYVKSVLTEELHKLRQDILRASGRLPN